MRCDGLRRARVDTASALVQRVPVTNVIFDGTIVIQGSHVLVEDV